MTPRQPVEDREFFFRAHAAHRAALLQMEALQIATRNIQFERPGSEEPANLTDNVLTQVYKMIDHCLESVRQAIGLEPPPSILVNADGSVTPLTPKGLYVDKDGELSMQVHPPELEAGDG